jgi:peptidoglycan hydrolase-like protein with peptidoglycan-binding domain
MSRLPLFPGDSGDLVKQMQGALIGKGYSCGPSGADGKFNDGTLAGLESFQGDNALLVQPRCDQADWTALGLPGPG